MAPGLEPLTRATQTGFVLAQPWLLQTLEKRTSTWKSSLYIYMYKSAFQINAQILNTYMKITPQMVLPPGAGLGQAQVQRSELDAGLLQWVQGPQNLSLPLLLSLVH